MELWLSCLFDVAIDVGVAVLAVLITGWLLSLVVLVVVFVGSCLCM